MFEFMEYINKQNDTVRVYEENETLVIINWDTKKTDFIEDFKNPTWLLCKKLQNELDEIVYIHEDYIQGIIFETEEDGNMEELKQTIIEFCKDNYIKF